MNSSVFVILASGMGFIALCGIGCDSHSKNLDQIDPAQCTVEIRWDRDENNHYPHVILYSRTPQSTTSGIPVPIPNYGKRRSLSAEEMKDVLRLLPNLTKKPIPTDAIAYVAEVKSKDRVFSSVLGFDRTTLSTLQAIADVLPEEKREPIQSIISYMSVPVEGASHESDKGPSAGVSKVFYKKREPPSGHFRIYALSDSAAIDRLRDAIRNDVKHPPDRNRRTRTAERHALSFYTNENSLVFECVILGDNYLIINGDRYGAKSTLACLQELMKKDFVPASKEMTEGLSEVNRYRQE